MTRKFFIKIIKKKQKFFSYKAILLKFAVLTSNSDKVTIVSLIKIFNKLQLTEASRH
jgi:hypothetical protein